MPTFLYVGDDERVFPARDGDRPSFVVKPGDTVDLDANPDEAFFDVADGEHPGQVNSEQPAADVVPEPEQTQE